MFSWSHHVSLNGKFGDHKLFSDAYNEELYFVWLKIDSGYLIMWSSNLIIRIFSIKLPYCLNENKTF